MGESHLSTMGDHKQLVLSVKPWEMLPDHEQCNLCICKGYHHSKPEANQIRMDSTLYSERAEYNERKACILCSSPTGLCEGRCGSLPTQERWQSKPDLIQLLTHDLPDSNDPDEEGSDELGDCDWIGQSG